MPKKDVICLFIISILVISMSAFNLTSPEGYEVVQGIGGTYHVYEDGSREFFPGEMVGQYANGTTYVYKDNMITGNFAVDLFSPLPNYISMFIEWSKEKYYSIRDWYRKQ